MRLNNENSNIYESRMFLFAVVESISVVLLLKQCQLHFHNVCVSVYLDLRNVTAEVPFEYLVIITV